MVTAPLRGLMAMVLVLLALVGGCSRVPQGPAAPEAAPIAGTAPAGRLQEVPAPPLVSQLAGRLEDRRPQLEILAPADGALLPAGPWTLALRLRDWPLADAGPLGLGPHVVVQVDGEIVQRLSRPEELGAIALPELSPGSHRVTVYAARPWGEAVKEPGASRQIRVHRVAANPQQLPAPGSAQLILASPSGLAEAEPVLIDWLLFDAPLQNLRDGDGRWRLRVTVNGDSFLVDRQAPLWLRGFERNGNALQLELLDGRGEPLNGPFNSLVRDVPIRSGPQPGWLRGSLTPLELDQLSGLAPVEADVPPAEADAGASVAEAEPEAADAEPPAAPPEPVPAAPVAVEAEQEQPSAAADPPTDDDGSTDGAPGEAEVALQPPGAPFPAAADGAPAPQAVDGSAADVEPGAEPVVQPAPEPEGASGATTGAATGAAPEASPAPSPAPPLPPAAPIAGEERIAPSTGLEGSARQLVNADGTLVQPSRTGPLARLRARLQR